MNRNVESHFSEVPGIDIQRSVFDRSFSHKTSFNVGDVIPIFVDEVLPGSTFDISTSKVVRLQTMLDPIMDNIYLDTYFFFVPNRLTWIHWKNFCGQNDASPWVPSTEYTIPVQKSPESTGFWPGSLADYFGLPLGVQFAENSPLAPSALPFRAYALIINEFFRDQNLQVPLGYDLGDGNSYSVPEATARSMGYNNPYQASYAGLPWRAARFHDYFSSCLPAPQKHDPIKMLINIPPLPVVTGPTHEANLNFRNTVWKKQGTGGDTLLFDYGSGDARKAVFGASSTYQAANAVVPVNFWTSGTNNPDYSADTNSSLSINDLRIAFQLQKFYERCARGGTRYSEFIRAQFSTDVPDARVQRPEYLGGNRIRLNVHEVTNNAQSETDFLGDLGAMSVTADHHSDFIHSFTEHGLVIGLAVARYDHSYSQGLERFWTRKHLTDFYLPVFANIGEQPVYQAEIYATAENMAEKTVFGYQEAWADYRYKPNRVSGEMRPDVPNTLASWHLADNYSAAPVLGASWIQEDPTNVDRVLAVSHTVSNQIFADFYFNYKATLPMPMYSVPGLIDHN